MYNTQEGNLKGTSYLSLILKTDVGLGRNSLPSCIFLSFSDQILLIAINRNFPQADGFQRPCQEDSFTLSLLPAPPALEFPVAEEAVNSRLVQGKEAKTETWRQRSLRISCVAPRSPVWTKSPREAASTAEAAPASPAFRSALGGLGTLNCRCPRASGKLSQIKSKVNTGT